MWFLGLINKVLNGSENYITRSFSKHNNPVLKGRPKVDLLDDLPLPVTLPVNKPTNL